MTICPECGERFVANHHRQLFCSPAHKKAHGNRQLGRGSSVVSLLQTWQAAKGSKDPAAKEAARLAFALLCRQARAFNADDKAAGRMDAVKLFQLRQAAGLFE